MAKHSKLCTVPSGAAEPNHTSNILDTNYTSVTESHLYAHTTSTSALTDAGGQCTFSLSKINTQLAGFFLSYKPNRTQNCFTVRIRQKNEELCEQGHVLNYFLTK